ncbi:MAG: PfkB family carbohydrate kinase [Actinomycetia bacterium]|nr:PfkB family carbohydrate kinase [Actinomycetes bacterium]
MSAEFDVIVVGSVNMDMVVHASSLPGPGFTVTGGVFERHGGGKGANQAAAAARLGARVALISAVGDDPDGRDSVEELEDRGVDVSHVVKLSDAATGVALIVVDDQGENQIAVASGANGRLDTEMVEVALREMTLSDTGVCLVGFEVGDGPIEAVSTWAYANGHRVVLDPAPARPISDAIAACAPILTPNLGESLELTAEADIATAAASLARLTNNAVVITQGSDGVLLLDEGGIATIPSYHVTAVDSTGAGDVFAGAFAVGLTDAMSVANAVDMGQAAAALSTQIEGARAGVPSREEVEAFIS